MRTAKRSHVFDRLAHHSQCSWNTLITHQIKSGMSQQALTLYQQMPKDDFTRISGHTYVTLLKACTKLKNLKQGLCIHADVARVGLLECDLFIGNSLIDLYAKLGLLEKAQQVFDKLSRRDVISWTALIAGYVEQGHGETALAYFEVMKQEGVSPNAVTYICILKACSSLRATNKGREIHDEIERQGLIENDLFVSSTLVDMYAKCGLLNIALQLFDRLPYRDVVSWTTLIAGYVEHGYAQQALDYFHYMQLEGVSPNHATFVCILKACGSVGAIERGNELRTVAKREGFLEDLPVVNTLIDMYMKLGLLMSAQEVFDSIRVRDVVSWTALIAGYVEDGQGQKALECYEQMEHNGISPNPVTLVCSLKACGCTGAVDKGWQLHSEIESRGLLREDVAVGNALVDMYAKCGAFSCAQQVFEKLPVRDVVSWNALITTYAEQGYGKEALEFFERMHCEGVPPDIITYVYGLKSCGSIGATESGREIHAEIERWGLIDRELVIGNTLIEMYANCGLIAIAQQVFDKLLTRNAVTWNVLISAYAEHGYGEDALACFEEMQSEGVSPSPVTFICNLKACASTGMTDVGKELHSRIERHGLFEGDIVIGNSLVTMYAKWGLLVRAQQVFDKLPVQDVTSWNALMMGYAEHGHGGQALNFFEQMQLHGVGPNMSTLICSLKACGILRDVEMGQEIHVGLESYGLLERESATANTLVHMYVKCGSLDVAWQVFSKLRLRDLVTWNTLIAGYNEYGYGEDILRCFDQMLYEGFCPTAAAFVCYLKSFGTLRALEKGRVALWNLLIERYAHYEQNDKALEAFECLLQEGACPDAWTFICSLNACRDVGAISKGQGLHSEVEKRGLLNEALVGNTLVSMYAKCGYVVEACRVFDGLHVRDVISWTALMSGYAKVGQAADVLKVFNRMVEAGTMPDSVSSLVSLKAHNMLGWLRGDESYFEAVVNGYGNALTLEHYSCIVKLFSLAGQLDAAVNIIEKTPPCSKVVMWHVLLGACRQVGCEEYGKLAFKHSLCE